MLEHLDLALAEGLNQGLGRQCCRQWRYGNCRIFTKGSQELRYVISGLVAAGMFSEQRSNNRPFVNKGVPGRQGGLPRR